MIIIFEGPAGSGKSTAVYETVSLIKNAMQVEHQHQFTKVRDFGGKSPALILAREAEKWYGALGYIVQGWLPVIDRFYLSAFVYDIMLRSSPGAEPFGHILDSDDFANWDMEGRFVRYMLDRINPILRDQVELFETLARYQLGPEHLEIHWVFMLPTIDELERRRSQSARAFPFRAENELRAYAYLYDVFQRSHQLAYKTPRIHVINDVKELPDLIKAFPL